MCFNLRWSCNANPELNSTRNHVLSGNENVFSSHLQFWHFQIQFVIELVASNNHSGQREVQLQPLMSPSTQSQQTRFVLRINKYNRVGWPWKPSALQLHVSIITPSKLTSSISMHIYLFTIYTCLYHFDSMWMGCPKSHSQIMLCCLIIVLTGSVNILCQLRVWERDKYITTHKIIDVCTYDGTFSGSVCGMNMLMMFATQSNGKQYCKKHK